MKALYLAVMLVAATTSSVWAQTNSSIYNYNPNSGTWRIYNPQTRTTSHYAESEVFCQLCAEKEEARIRYWQQRERAERQAVWQELRALRREMRRSRGEWFTDDDE